MLYKSLFRRALAVHLTTNHIRFASSMAMPVESFKLDRSIFNETLYSRIRDYWFADLSPGATTHNDAAKLKWFGVGLSDEAKAKQDSECRSNFAHALEAIGPENLALPSFESHENDIKNAATISKPFLSEVESTNSADPQKGSDTLLSLVLLLDQFSRNIYRTPSTLPLVFNHYDRLSHTLVHATNQSVLPNPILHPSHSLRLPIRQWYIMPLMHSEHLPSHDLFAQVMTRQKVEVESAGDVEAVEQIKDALQFEAMHLGPLRRFGRYPHRNAALGRESSAEERKFLEEGETFGVKQDGKPKFEKSEL